MSNSVAPEPELTRRIPNIYMVTYKRNMSNSVALELELATRILISNITKH
jgi:hypothetical protein